MKKGKLGTLPSNAHESSLRPVNEIWADVERVLGVTRQDAASFVGSLLLRERVFLHTLDESQGVWTPQPIDSDAYKRLLNLEKSGYAEGKNETAQEGSAIRISLRDAETILAEAEAVGVGGYRSWMATETARLMTELEQARQELLRRLRKLGDEKPEQLFRVICESVVNHENLLLNERSPFGSYVDGQEIKSRWHDLAAACLRKLDKDKPKIIDSTYMPLAEFVFKEFSIHPCFPDSHLQNCDGEVLLDETFGEPAFEYAVALWRVAELAYHGVPLVRLTDDAPELLLEPDELYVFLKKKGELNDIGDLEKGGLPKWIEGLAIDIRHLEAHQLIFGGSIELERTQVLARRSALRKMLALPEGVVPEPGAAQLPTQSKLQSLLKPTIDRYYGDNFDINDNETWPSQKDVVAWLEGLGLSHREAVSIDLVTRPDRLRGM